jgi:hypothetical protein
MKAQQPGPNKCVRMHAPHQMQSDTTTHAAVCALVRRAQPARQTTQDAPAAVQQQNLEPLQDTQN